ncbi:hypothetical protein CAI21_14315 [Alkalilimnicola ehrlichii]|uniref:Uncharacterized protein n=1 Tax=Alkalilimnicola ehrlichii TaxID=351052 RepID=A0A3E0WKU2_9GAMM|nr:hypothetical protein CAI21_14315 [Alkalilimnicola ehrlichii]RFA33572.1 hypothetical protein CAL65_17110 [Alkalilimnicola ehrlichii]
MPPKARPTGLGLHHDKGSLRQLFLVIASVWTPENHDVVLAVLALVDTTLIASLLLILLFSGYRNFVARPLTCPLARER